VCRSTALKRCCYEATRPHHAAKHNKRGNHVSQVLCSNPVARTTRPAPALNLWQTPSLTSCCRSKPCISHVSEHQHHYSSATPSRRNPQQQCRQTACVCVCMLVPVKQTCLEAASNSRCTLSHPLHDTRLTQSLVYHSCTHHRTVHCGTATGLDPCCRFVPTSHTTT